VVDGHHVQVHRRALCHLVPCNARGSVYSRLQFWEMFSLQTGALRDYRQW
jgi:hypothetical protein